MSGTALSMIGLGALGAPIARTLAESGAATLTVWNRTPEKAEAAIAAGAIGADSAVDAISRSDVLFLCVNDAAAVRAILDNDGVEDALRGKAVVNLSTLSGEEALELNGRLARAEVRFLQAGVNAYPRDIGREGTSVLYAGDKELFDDLSDTLRTIGGAVTYLGSDASAVSTLYMAMWSYYFTAVVGFFEAAVVADRAGLSITAFRDIVASVMQTQIVGGIDDAVRRVADDDLGGDQGRLTNTAATIGVYADATRALGVKAAFVTASADYLRAADVGGIGERNLAALFSFLNARAS